jgi:hypothetical protein
MDILYSCIRKFLIIFDLEWKIQRQSNDDVYEITPKIYVFQVVNLYRPYKMELVFSFT